MRFLVLFLGLAVMVSCGGKKEGVKEDFVANETPEEKQKGMDEIAQGEALVKQSDCSTCHHKTTVIIGPAHLDVAKKYPFTEENVNMIADKIIKGGVGNWGQTPMNAHPDVSEEDAVKMAKYILAMDGEKQQ